MFFWAISFCRKPEGSVVVKPCWPPCWFGHPQSMAAVQRPFLCANSSFHLKHQAWWTCTHVQFHDAPMWRFVLVFFICVRQFLLIHGVSSNFPLSVFVATWEFSAVAPGHTVLFKLWKREKSRGGSGVEKLFGFHVCHVFSPSGKTAFDLIFKVAWTMWVFDITFLL